jgi:hypothetical protein
MGQIRAIPGPQSRSSARRRHGVYRPTTPVGASRSKCLIVMLEFFDVFARLTPTVEASPAQLGNKALEVPPRSGLGLCSTDASPSTMARR